jgi:hypothetical protein
MRVQQKVNCAAVLALVACGMSGDLAAQTTPAEAEAARQQSVLRRASDAFDRRMRTLSRASGQADTLEEYALKCDAATGITVPAFDCTNGVTIPGQGNVPAYHGGTCDNPNVLNGECDPGSRFQVLPGGNADAVAVAHCRKDGQPVNNHLYDDIAVIQYNKKNGAVCFYQALKFLPGKRVPAPRNGTGPWDPGAADGNQGAWWTPSRTADTGCAGCHDTGGFIRSPYLARLKQPPHVLPNQSTGFDNLNPPLKFVGRDFAHVRGWSIDAPPGDSGNRCNSCHRLAVSNGRLPRIRDGEKEYYGTAATLALTATATQQKSKNPHSPQSPIWMRPGQIHHDAGTEASARIYSDCARKFIDSSFMHAPPGCVLTPLGEPWSEALPPLASIYLLLGFPEQTPDFSIAPIMFLTHP